MTIINPVDPSTLTLAAGAHEPDDGAWCVMEAAAFIAGEPWSDHPACASKVIGEFLRSWNDALPDDDRQQLAPYAVKVIGTACPADVEAELSWMATDWLVRVQTPAWLRLAGLTVQADRLAGMTPLNATTVPSIQPTLDAIRKDAAAAGAATWDAARTAAGAAGDAAWAAAWAAARDAARAAARAAAGAAAGDAAGAAAGAAAGDAAWAAAWAAARTAAGAAGAAAWDAAWAALAPTVLELQTAAHQLVDQMITHAKESNR